MDDTLQTVLTRVGETLFDMQGSDTREVHVDGGMLQGTGQKCSKQSVHSSAGQGDPDKWILPN